MGRDTTAAKHEADRDPYALSPFRPAFCLSINWKKEAYKRILIFKYWFLIIMYIVSYLELDQGNEIKRSWINYLLFSSIKFLILLYFSLFSILFLSLWVFYSLALRKGTFDMDSGKEWFDGRERDDERYGLVTRRTLALFDSWVSGVHVHHHIYNLPIWQIPVLHSFSSCFIRVFFLSQTFMEGFFVAMFWTLDSFFTYDTERIKSTVC